MNAKISHLKKTTVGIFLPSLVLFGLIVSVEETYMFIISVNWTFFLWFHQVILWVSTNSSITENDQSLWHQTHYNVKNNNVRFEGLDRHYH